MVTVGVTVGVRVTVGVLVRVGVLVGVFVLVGVSVNVGSTNPVWVGPKVEEGCRVKGVAEVSMVGVPMLGSERKVGVRLGTNTDGISVAGGKGLRPEFGSMKIDPKTRTRPSRPNKSKMVNTSQMLTRIFENLPGFPQSDRCSCQYIRKRVEPSRKGIKIKFSL